ncbi:MAG: hypothetical protein NTY66_01345, partial [Candidatus Vogelbacteria bacterium]|nr:hypothetical protein [Candidatus Vogelbacteria bacterium]
MIKKPFCTLAHARGEHQRKNMKQALKDGVCLFCPEHLAKYHTSPVERKGKFWTITKNDYPYAGTKIHYLFIA